MIQNLDDSIKLKSNNLELLSEEIFYTKLNYIHQNPVRAGYVEDEKHYIYSSSSNYAQEKGIIDIDFLN
jgi:hypothetical protein